MSPLTLNPANTGQFDGDYRIAANMRRQWASVTVPFKTYGISGEVKKPIKSIPEVSAGASIYTDKAGDSNFGTLNIGLSGSYSKSVNTDSTMFVSPGIAIALTQRNIDYTQLTFDNQYNGFRFDPSLGNNENFVRDSRWYPNLALGLSWNWLKEERKIFSAGFSWFNLGKPSQSFYNDPQAVLDQRLNIHGLLQWPVHEKLDVIPSFATQGQGKFREYIVGADVKYYLNTDQFNKVNLYLGAWLRAKDAYFFSAGLDYNDLKAKISYDINFSNLTPASQKRGGFEIGIIYIIKKVGIIRIPYKICPDYI